MAHHRGHSCTVNNESPVVPVSRPRLLGKHDLLPVPRATRALLHVQALQVYLTGLPRLDDGLPRLDDGLPRLDDGLPRLDDGLPRLVDGLPRLVDGLPRLVDGLPRLVDGLPRLVDGLPRLDVGLPRLDVGLPRLDEESREAVELPHGLHQPQPRGQFMRGLLAVDEADALLDCADHRLTQGVVVDVPVPYGVTHVPASCSPHQPSCLLPIHFEFGQRHLPPSADLSRHAVGEIAPGEGYLVGLRIIADAN